MFWKETGGGKPDQCSIPKIYLSKFEMKNGWENHRRQSFRHLWHRQHLSEIDRHLCNFIRWRNFELWIISTYYDCFWSYKSLLYKFLSTNTLKICVHTFDGVYFRNSWLTIFFKIIFRQTLLLFNPRKSVQMKCLRSKFTFLRLKWILE